jgi:hypothetical protein
MAKNMTQKFSEGLSACNCYDQVLQAHEKLTSVLKGFPKMTAILQTLREFFCLGEDEIKSECYSLAV